MSIHSVNIHTCPRDFKVVEYGTVKIKPVIHYTKQKPIEDGFINRSDKTIRDD